MPPTLEELYAALDASTSPLGPNQKELSALRWLSSALPGMLRARTQNVRLRAALDSIAEMTLDEIVANPERIETILGEVEL